MVHKLVSPLFILSCLILLMNFKEVFWDRIFPSPYIKPYGYVSNIVSGLFICASWTVIWILSNYVRLMSFLYLPSLRVLVFLSLVFSAIDYQRKPIIFDGFGVSQMNEVCQQMPKLLGREGGEERAKAITKAFFHLKYELKPKAVSCNTDFLSSLDKLFLL